MSYSARTSAAALFTLAAVGLVGCDGVSPDHTTATLAPDGNLVLEHTWVLPYDAQSVDVMLDDARVEPGGIVEAKLSSEPTGSYLVLTSERVGNTDQHIVALDAQGLTFSEVELVAREVGGDLYPLAKAAGLSDVPHGVTAATPASFHYEYGVDEDGNETFSVYYDFHEGGNSGRAVDAAAAAETVSGSLRTTSMDLTKAPGDFVGYRLRLEERVPGWSQLHIDGYSRVEIEESKARSFAGHVGALTLAR
jgi:hypothetical protein